MLGKKKKLLPKKKRPAKPKGKPKPRVKAAKARKPVPPKKPAAPPGTEEIGRVAAFFRIPVVAVVRITRGGLKIGDRIWIKGHTTDLKLTVTSMQINHQPVREIRKGDEAGIQVPSRARRGDRVYRIR